ncbi:NUDIX hydrolase [Streptomyces mobaraensis NBRC 13819 = DSM 40847]|uniref:NUDIX hydrolase n=2 Tax=Streptomyces mobaraensis TaxID=35621 RepID=A0A5N5WDP9_STRMB|nr:NUDIX hydrolase [Streptomyces mobaraensis]EMF02572.1 NUDIX hydrolase [Streptomyces mobaraensis NBRC 13819 = DSM 40847]KAB7851060.1 NUDIX hydrolase [Streptomyces mobaraensis]QTT75610.1 NUDIX hydrolase [Streptomyces mobaraensis NBRC 13819 = DSM 40847]
MSLREDAERVLKEWPAPSGEAGQEALRLAYLDHLADHPDGMWKACRDGHVTASALVVDPSRGRVLLTLHRKLGMWLQMGGHCEPEDATLAAAALREATEESGIASGLTLLPGGPVRLDRHHTPCAWHLDVQYAALAPEGAEAAISDESLDLRWFGYDEVASVADTSVVRLVERVRALV